MKKTKLLSLVSAAALLLSLVLSSIGGAMAADETLPTGATIDEDAPKLVMDAGDRDYVIGTESKYQVNQYRKAYYTDFGESYYYTVQGEAQCKEGVETPSKRFFAVAPNAGGYYGSFMGQKVYAIYQALDTWAGNGIVYNVKGGNYIAIALSVAKANTNKVVKDDFVIEYSTDNGATWTATDFDFSLDYDMNDAVNAAATPNTAFSTYKAVVKVPDGDVVKVRAMMGGGTAPDYKYAGNQATKATSCGGAFVSAYNLAEYDNWSDVPDSPLYVNPNPAPVIPTGATIAEDDAKLVMDAGDIDYVIGTESKYQVNQYRKAYYTDFGEMYYYTVQGEAQCKEGVETPSKRFFAVAPNAGGYYGSFMGQTVYAIYQALDTWAGNGIIYNVKGGNYIAIALSVAKANTKKVVKDDFIIEYSTDNGATWTATDFDFSLDYDMTDAVNAAATPNTAFSTYKAVVKVPDGDVVKVRAMMPGGTAPDYKYAGNQATKATSCGGAVVSAYDLSNYTKMSQIPDSPYYNPAEGGGEGEGGATASKDNLNKAIIYAEAINLNAIANNDAKTAFIAKLAEAKAYVDEEHTTEEYDAKAKELDDARAALTDRGVPSDATIEYGDETLVLRPGMIDEMDVSTILDEAGEPRRRGNGNVDWYLCYTDYGKIGLVSMQDGGKWHKDPTNQIHATSYDGMFFDKIYALDYKNTKLNGTYINCAAWGGCHVDYKVYAGSYVAVPIVVNKKGSSVSNWPTVQNDYRYFVSADGEEWTEIEATTTLLDTKGDFELYEAIAKVPEGNYFFRAMMPAMNEAELYYTTCPSYNHTFMGGAVTSMNDLSKIDDYTALPDATEYYDGPAIATTDEAKLQITEVYFKAMKDGMTIADAKAALKVTNGSVKFYDAEGKEITDEATALAMGMKVDLIDAKGFSMNKYRGEAMLEVTTGNNLLSIGEVKGATAENGADKTVEGLGLQATVKIEAASGSFDATIDWDFDNCEYDPAVTQTQKFTVNGVIVLPEGVTNSSNMDLNVSVEVTVNGSAIIGIASSDETAAKVDDENQILYVKEGMTVGELAEILSIIGDVDVAFSDMNGNEITDMDTVLEDGMTVDLYTEVAMVGYYEVMIGSDDDFASDDNVADDDNAADDNDGDNGEDTTPDTGVPMAMIPVALAVLGGAAVVASRKRK